MDVDGSLPQFDTRHVIAPDKGKLTDILPPLLSLSTERVTELLDLGSVYLNKKRVLEDVEVAPLSYIRVHCKPKRYPVTAVDWRSRVLFENEHFAVVDKPAGYPVPSAVDNVRDTVIAQIQATIGHKLMVTQRLDVPTRGLMVFAKTLEFQKGFNKLLANHQIRKEYVAETFGAPPLGLHVHFMKPSIAAPREVFIEGKEGWKECRLEVLKVVSTGENRYRSNILLLTGRTHQIRVQMKALNCPLWGDKIYGGPGPLNEFFLVSERLHFVCPVTHQPMEFRIAWQNGNC